MAHLNGFDATQVEPTTPFEPLPAGKYVACITASEMKATKQGDGSYLQLELTVLEGEYKGRKVWDRLCLNHSNPKAVQIARGTLSALCRSIGVLQPRDSAELHNVPLIVSVKCKKRNDTQEIANEIGGYESKSAAVPDASRQAPVNNQTPPWKR